MSLVKAGLIGLGLYFGGRYALDLYRRRRGVVVAPKTQAALQVAYGQAMREVTQAMLARGVSGNVSPGTVKGKPAILVNLDPGFNPLVVSRQLPQVAAGIAVHVA